MRKHLHWNEEGVGHKVEELQRFLDRSTKLSTASYCSYLADMHLDYLIIPM